MTSLHRGSRVRAPQLRGRGWLNTGGRSLDLADLRGKVVLLDFWTFCCVNCLHVLDELRPLEERFADVLVTIGVHSPKFVHEADADALAAAVERYAVHHAVLDDPTLATWDAYTAKAWPTLVVVDPEGYVVAHLSGEGHAHGLAVLVEELVAEHEARGTLHRGDGPYVPPPPPETALRFPGKAVALPQGGFLVSDTAHHQLVVLDPDLVTERARIGSGDRGLLDGDPAVARFSEPQGLALLPPEVAARVGYDVAVADSVNHALRGVRVADGAVRTLAGTGTQLRRRVLPEAGPAGSGPSLDLATQELSTPWDVAWFDGRVVVAMAGSHQLWAYDPVPPSLSVLAGTTNEGLADGALANAWFAQPSGLAVTCDGDGLVVADSETSAVRQVSRDGTVATLVGRGLFDFGFLDGPVGGALLQHPLGVAVLPDGSVAVADTYNGAVRRVDPVRGEVSTLATGLAEPSDVLVENGRDGAVLVVVESAAHRLVRVPLPAAAQRVAGDAHQVRRPATTVPPGPLTLAVRFTPPTGQKLDDRYGDPTRLTVSASPPSLLVSGSGTAQGLSRELVLARPGAGGGGGGVAEVGGGADGGERGEDGRDGELLGVLHVSAQAAACDQDGTEFAACHLYQQDWGIPLRVTAAAPDSALPGGVLELHLRGV